jgi:hypothetical protein
LIQHEWKKDRIGESRDNDDPAAKERCRAGALEARSCRPRVRVCRNAIQIRHPWRNRCVSNTASETAEALLSMVIRVRFLLHDFLLLFG